MTDDRGRSTFLQQCPVPRETLRLLDRYVELLLAQNGIQNLIAKSTEAEVWTRHILDSAQLLALMPAHARTCLDVGSGAGLPGVVLAMMSDVAFTLVEPRRLRADFLTNVVRSLELVDRVEVAACKVERLAHDPVDVITARAFTSLSATIEATRRFADARTTWLLPKGRSVAGEVADAEARWNADFEVVPSLTATDAAIVRVGGLRTGLAT